MKKIYTIVSVFCLVLVVGAFVFLICVLNLPDERIDEIGFEALFVFFFLLLIAVVILLATEKEYYNDAESWQPGKIKIPKLGKVSFADFFKQQLLKNGFSEFLEYNDNPKNAGIQVFYLKEQKKVLCIALIDSNILSKRHYFGLFTGIPEKLQEYNIARKSMLFMAGTFLPVIYCDKKDKRLKQLLKEAAFQHTGFNVFPCVASLDEGMVYVIRLVVSYYKGQRSQHNDKKAVSIIDSILNN